MDTLRRLGGMLHPYRKSLALALVLTVFACLLNLAVPLLFQGLIDTVAAAHPGVGPAPHALGLLAVFAGAAGLNLLVTVLVGRVRIDLVRDLRLRLYARLQRLSLAYFDRTPAGSIISRLTDDVASVQALVTQQTLTVCTDVGTALLVAGWLAWSQPYLLLVLLTFVPPYLLLFRRFIPRIRDASRTVRERLDVIFSHLKAKIDGILVVKAHAREEAEIAAFAGQIDAAHEPRLRLGRLTGLFGLLNLTGGGVGAAVVFTAGAFQVLDGRMTPGELASAAALAALFFGPLARLADLAALLQQSGASVVRLAELLEQSTDVPEPAAPVCVGKARGEVDVDGVYFAYQTGRDVLHDINLKVWPGMKVALVGPTGCGKSTLMNLLLRFYDPRRGEIRLDGVPLGQMAVADLRRQIGIVPQDTVIFRATLADNIRYGVPQAGSEQVERAARAALLEELVATLPHGYDTLIGEGGYKLSQGERQRVAIARACCKDPALVVLDEATSALDTESELLVQAALENLFERRTVFVVAHRLSTILDADMIVVLEQGRVIQTGTHEELLAQPGGLYRRLCARQFRLSAFDSAPDAAGRELVAAHRESA